MTSISARNVTPRRGFSNLNKLGTYFTLHLNNEEGNLILQVINVMLSCEIPLSYNKMDESVLQMVTS